MKNLLQNTLLILLSTLLSLLILEFAYRTYLKFSEADGIEALNSTAGLPETGQAAKLGHMIQLTQNPRIIYELIPEISVVHRGVTVTTNRNGFRGPEVSQQKHDDQRRIVGIGDSVMFGWGVEDENSYLNLLENKLNAGHGNSHWQVVNMAVPGYNTAMEVETLKEKGLAYQPDVVILGFVPNDFSLPRFIRQQDNYLAVNRSFMLERFGLTRDSTSGLTDTPSAFLGGIHNANLDLDKVPPQYRDMVGLPGVTRSFDELARLSSEFGFEVIVIVFRYWPKELAQAAKAHGFRVINSHLEWGLYARAHGLEKGAAGMRLNDQDPHPSADGHAAIAEGLYSLLAQSNIGY